MLVATDTDQDDSSSTDRSMDSRDDELLVLDNPMVHRSARLQRNVPKPRRFEIVPLSLTKEQRREYVKYKEDDEGNLM